MSNLNVYLVELDEKHHNYGDPESAVVVATDPNDARTLMFDQSRLDYRWFHPTEVTVTVIAENPIGERGVILTHDTPQ